MRDDFQLPFFTSTWSILAIFIIALLSLDLVLVRYLKLGKIAWKRVDYIWLAFAITGVIGAVSESRQIIARNLYASASSRLEGSFSMLRWRVDIYATGSAICRTFIKSEFSPPPREFERLQREYDEACKWFRQIPAAIPKTLDDNPKEIAVSSLPPAPSVTSGDLLQMISNVFQAIDRFNDSIRTRQQLRAEAQRSRFEEVLFVMSPLFFALALALRVAKVTGEIRLES